MKPTRELVERIATEEALDAHCTLTELIHMRRTPAAKAARVRAWARIIEATECTGTELAEAWGCSRMTIYAAFPERYSRSWIRDPARPEPDLRPLLPQPPGFRVPAYMSTSLEAALDCFDAVDRWRFGGGR